MGKIYIEERAVNLAQYIIDSGDTVRGAAKKFGISKSTVHTDVTLKNGRKRICRQNCNRTSFIPNAGHINSEGRYDTFENIVSYLESEFTFI